MSTAYRYMLAIARNRNITRAAGELYITQPALTRYLNRLEADLGVKLFVRSREALFPTPEGQIYLDKAAQICALEDALLKSLKADRQKVQGPLSLGITPEFSKALLPHILPAYMSEYPGVTIRLEEDTNSALEARVRQGRLEFALMADHTAGSDLQFAKLFEDPMLLVMPESHPIAQSFDLTDNSPYTPYFLDAGRVGSEDFVLCPASVGVGAVARDIFRRHNMSPHILLSPSQNETAVQLVSAGVGMTITTARSALRIDLHGKLACFSLDDPILTRKRGICFRPGRKFSPAAEAFLTRLKVLLVEDPEFQAPVCQLICKR